MSQKVTLEEAMHYCGFTGETRTSYQKVRFFFHVVRQIAPDFEAFGHYPMDDQIDAPAAEWDAIKDAVKERVRVYRRGGVHQSSDNEVVVETDEEFHYNAKVKKVLAKEEDEGLYIGATRPAFLKDYNVARKAVRVAQFSHRDKAALDAAIEHLAVIYLRYRGTPGWHTRTAVLDGTSDLSPLTH